MSRQVCHCRLEQRHK